MLSYEKSVETVKVKSRQHWRQNVAGPWRQKVAGLGDKLSLVARRQLICCRDTATIILSPTWTTNCRQCGRAITKHHTKCFWT